MKQLILLAGLHKTATTSIQQTCAANQNILLRHGLPYPTFPAAGHQDASNHTRIFTWFRQDPGRAGLSGQFRWPSDDFSEREQELAKLAGVFATLPDRLLMAAEGVSVFSVQELEQLKAWFAGQGWHIQIICHVRHLSSWINSMIAQRVTSAMALSIPQAIDDYLQHGSIVRRRIESIRAVFPDAIFHSHEKALKYETGPVGYFLRNLGVAPGLPIKFVRANEGSSDLAARVLSLVNEKFGAFGEDGKPNPRAHGNRSFVNAVKTLGGRKFTLRAAEVAPLMPLLHADNQWLKETLGDDFHDTRMAFEDRPCEWAVDTLARLQQIIAATPVPVREWIADNTDRLDIDPVTLALPA